MTLRPEARTVMLLVVVAVVIGWVTWTQYAGERARDLEDLHVGECVTVPSGDFSNVLAVPVVACGRSHNAELYLIDRLDRRRERDYPGAEVARAEAIERCSGSELADYLGGSPDRPDIEVVVMWPSDVDWWPTRGAVHCFVRLSGDATTSDRIGGED